MCRIGDHHCFVKQIPYWPETWCAQGLTTNDLLAAPLVASGLRAVIFSGLTSANCQSKLQRERRRRKKEKEKAAAVSHPKTVCLTPCLLTPEKGCPGSHLGVPIPVDDQGTRILFTNTRLHCFFFSAEAAPGSLAASLTPGFFRLRAQLDLNWLQLIASPSLGDALRLMNCPNAQYLSFNTQPTRHLPICGL